MSYSMILNVLVNTVIQNYFQDSRCMFLFYDNFRNFEYHGNIPIVNIKVNNQTIINELIFQSYGCQILLINHSNASRIIVQLEHQMKLHDDRFNFRKYLIIPTENSENLETDIFALPILQYIVDFLLIIPDDNSTVIEECEDNFKLFCTYQGSNYKLLTHSYVGKQNNNAPKILDVWLSENDTFLHQENLYPDKITNQEKRILRCATFDYKPYSILEIIPTISKGSENSIAHEYIKRHNMTLEYITDDEEWGIIYDNWTGNGILGNIATDKADIGYGALYTWAHEYGFLDLSKPAVRTGISCLAPAPKLASGWLTPFFPFSLVMWICTGISFLLTWLTISIITKLTLNRHQQRKHLENQINNQTIFIESFIRVVRVFLIQSLTSTENAFGFAFRYMSIIFLFGVFLTSTYSSGLATVMTVPRYDGAINTAQDLADSGMHWGATQDAWIFSIMSDTRPQYVALLKMFISTTEDNLIEFSKTDNFAFSIERLPSGQYAIGSYITENAVQKLRLLHEDLYWEYCVFMLPKSSPLLESLDTFLLELAQTGLILFWEMKAAQIHMDLRVQNIVSYYTTSNKKDEGDSTVKLKWMHVEGTFSILIVGYIISALVFFKEIIEHKCKKKTKNSTM